MPNSAATASLSSSHNGNIRCEESPDAGTTSAAMSAMPIGSDRLTLNQISNTDTPRPAAMIRRLLLVACLMCVAQSSGRQLGLRTRHQVHGRGHTVVSALYTDWGNSTTTRWELSADYG